MESKIILLGGRTGGPIIPLLAIAKNLHDTQPIIFGVSHGFEQKVAKERGYHFIEFPEAKLRLLTFKGTGLVEKISHLLDFIKSAFLLAFSILKAFITLIQLKPAAVLSSGSFLAVPVIIAAKILNALHYSSIKIIIHQQDPDPGLTNRLTAQWADLLTCVFESTRKHPKFKRASIIPNPFDTETTTKKYIDLLKPTLFKNDPELSDFIYSSKKPIMLVFGGGSGSEFINNWVYENKDRLKARFDIIHLTGTHREKSHLAEDEGYISREFLLDGMKIVLFESSVVISRCGMGSITELQNLEKPAFLVPLPDSHQESNALEVKEQFFILYQDLSPTWVETIFQKYPKWFNNTSYIPANELAEQLNGYYSKIQDLISKKK